jgi:hypothetical protein
MSVPAGLKRPERKRSMMEIERDVDQRTTVADE